MDIVNVSVTKKRIFVVDVFCSSVFNSAYKGVK